MDGLTVLGRTVFFDVDDPAEAPMFTLTILLLLTGEILFEEPGYTDYTTCMKRAAYYQRLTQDKYQITCYQDFRRSPPPAHSEGNTTS